MVQIKAKAIDGQMEHGRVLTTSIANWERAAELDPSDPLPPHLLGSTASELSKLPWVASKALRSMAPGLKAYTTEDALQTCLKSEGLMSTTPEQYSVTNCKIIGQVPSAPNLAMAITRRPKPAREASAWSRTDPLGSSQKPCAPHMMRMRAWLALMAGLAEEGRQGGRQDVVHEGSHHWRGARGQARRDSAEGARRGDEIARDAQVASGSSGTRCTCGASISRGDRGRRTGSARLIWERLLAVAAASKPKCGVLKGRTHNGWWSRATV